MWPSGDRVLSIGRGDRASNGVTKGDGSLTKATGQKAKTKLTFKETRELESLESRITQTKKRLPNIDRGTSRRRRRPVPELFLEQQRLNTNSKPISPARPNSPNGQITTTAQYRNRAG